MINEVFPNPTVQQVIFQIKYPNLFYLENKIGEYQIKIMKEFPESYLSVRQQIVLAEFGLGAKLEEYGNTADKDITKKIWHFRSENQYELNITSDSLDITSQFHKTYNNQQSDIRFRDIIKFAVDSFIELTSVPILHRIGLRYIDECPIPEKNNASFRAYYNSVFPLDRFDLKDATEMDFKTLISRGNYKLRYIESLQMIKSEPKLILDFDGFAEKIDTNKYLEVTDELHKIISQEFECSIRKPLIEYMRKGSQNVLQ